MLVETLIVSVFVGVTLIILYIQLQNMTNSYDKTFAYNTTTSLYNASKIKKYLYTRNIDEIKNEVGSAPYGYVDITNCGLSFYELAGEDSSQVTNLCKKLYERLNVKTIIITKSDLTNIKEKIELAGQSDRISAKMVDFVKYIRSEKRDGYLRLIIEYDDGKENSSFATILLKV